MAADARLLEDAEAGRWSARLYTWSTPWVTLGRFQDPGRDLLRPCPIPWVSRPTGGRAVLHGHDLTVGLAAPLVDLVDQSARRSVRAIYRAVTEPLIEALRAVGIPACLGEQLASAGVSAPWGPSADCFAYTAPNDIVDQRSGRKVCGCAMRVTEAAALIQVSIPVRDAIVDPASVFLLPATVHATPIEESDLAQALGEVLARAETRAAETHRSA